ncbi:hypothetical protein KA005_12450 [bacterium]|nr:hypothetical protein [bacterium]
MSLWCKLRIHDFRYYRGKDPVPSDYWWSERHCQLCGLGQGRSMLGVDPTDSWQITTEPLPTVRVIK